MPVTKRLKRRGRERELSKEQEVMQIIVKEGDNETKLRGYVLVFLG